MEEIDGHVAVITETWFKKSDGLEELLRDAEDVTGYGFIRKDRQETGSELRGGGVAIVYKKSNIEMTELKIKGRYEIIASLGRRTGQKRKIITIGAYIQPSADAETSREFLEELGNTVRRFKTKYCSPYFIIAGDFNKKKIGNELKEFTDIKMVRSGPTRGKNTLDLIFTNFPQYIKEQCTLPALFNADGVESDHAAVHLIAKIPRVPDYQIEKYSYIKQTDEGDRSFKECLEAANWESVTKETDPNTMTAALHAIFEDAMSKSYQIITTTRKSSQPQWINQYVLDLIDQRRAVFRREGRSLEWKRLKKRTRAIIKRRKAFFNKKKQEKMLAADSKSFHRYVRSTVSDEKTKSWTPRQMFPNLGPVEVAEKCADFFNGISAEYQPLLAEQIPVTLSLIHI